MKQEIKERIEKIRKGEVPEGYKKTKVGIIPNEWSVGKLGDLGDFRKGKGISGNDIKKTGLPAIMYGDIYVKYNTFFKKADFRIDEETSKNSISINKGDLLFTGSGETAEEIGKCVSYQGDDEIYIGGDIIALTLNGGHSLFLAYQQNSYSQIKQKAKLGQGYSVVHIYEKHIRGLNILLPRIKEPEKIAEILYTWDKAIELKEKLIKEKKEFKIGLMQKLLTGKIRFPGFTGEWTDIPLNNIVERITSKNEENNKTVITISSKEGFVNQDEYFNKIVASKDLSEYFLLKKGDFVYNKSYSNGYPVGAIKRLDSFEKAVVTTLYICFRIKEKKVSSNFLKYYFDSGLLNNQINRIANEGGRAHGLLNVTPNDFFNVKVNLPEYEEQEKISEILLTNEQDIQLSEKNLFELKEQKKGLMQLLLTGIVRVNI